jgi:hypothetical protein
MTKGLFKNQSVIIILQLFAVANHGPGSDLPSHGEQTFSTSCYMNINCIKPARDHTDKYMKNIDVMIYLKKEKQIE